MTFELSRADATPPIDHSAIRWMSPAVGLWVATRGGDHAGVVERRNGRYHARSARGGALGSFEGLEDALAAVDGDVALPPGAPRGVGPVRDRHPRLWALSAAAAVALVMILW